MVPTKLAPKPTKTVRKIKGNKNEKKSECCDIFAWTFVNGPEKLHKKQKLNKKLTFPFKKEIEKIVSCFSNGDFQSDIQLCGENATYLALLNYYAFCDQFLINYAATNSLFE